jgi:hypothetical protein
VRVTGIKLNLRYWLRVAQAGRSCAVASCNFVKVRETVVDTAHKEPESETLNTKTQPDELPLAPNTQSSRSLTIVVACSLGLVLLMALLFIVAQEKSPNFSRAPTLTSTPTPAPTPSPSLASNGAPVPDVTSFSGTNGATIYIDGTPYGVENPNMPYSLTNPDSQTLRFELHSKEYWVTSGWSDLTDNNGAERTQIDGGAGPLIPNTSTIHITYQLMFEPGQANSAGWMVLGQLSSVGGSPPFSIEMEGEDLAIRLGWLSSQKSSLPIVWTANVNGNPVSYGYVYSDRNPVQRGHYYTMDITINFANGTLSVFRDGVQIVNYYGPMGFGGPAHWDYGVNRAPTTNDIQAADYRNMVLTSSP